jgi:LCP family protein required for cell wall assembly
VSYQEYPGAQPGAWTQAAPAAGRRRRRGRPVAAAVGLALVFGAAGAAGTIVAANRVIDTVPRVADVDDVLTTDDGEVENFLLVGSDSRANSDPNSPDFGGIGSEADVSGTRSDTIMVLRRDRDSGDVALLSIPRDLWVDIAGERGDNRINAAFNDGPATLVATVQQALGLPIHHYVEVDFSGFKSLIDAIGGVELCFQYPARDVNSGLDIPEPGCHELDGVQALAYARSRYYEEFRDGDWRVDGTADIGRTRRQREFVNVALQAALDEIQANPFVAGDVLSSAGSAVRLDTDLDILAAAISMRSAVDGGLQPYELPVAGANINGNSVLQLAGGSDEVLAYFAGRGPAPAPAP